MTSSNPGRGGSQKEVFLREIQTQFKKSRKVLGEGIRSPGKRRRSRCRTNSTSNSA